MVKCLACGYENNAAEESCAQCASSLALRLCSVCEAVNAERDERCHSCGASLHAEAAARVPAGSRPAISGRRRLPALFIVPMALVAGAVAFYFYGWPLPEFITEAMLRPAAPALLVEVSPPPGSSDKEMLTVAAPEPLLEPSPPPDSTDNEPVPRALVTVSVPPPSSLSAEPTETALTKAAPEPPVELSLPSAPPDWTDKEPVPGNIATVSVTPPPAPDIGPPMPNGRSPVTHTRAWAARTHARVTHTQVPEAAADTTGVIAGEKQPADCAPGVAALGLCSRN